MTRGKGPRTLDGFSYFFGFTNVFLYVCLLPLHGFSLRMPKIRGQPLHAAKRFVFVTALAAAEAMSKFKSE